MNSRLVFILGGRMSRNASLVTLSVLGNSSVRKSRLLCSPMPARNQLSISVTTTKMLRSNLTCSRSLTFSFLTVTHGTLSLSQTQMTSAPTVFLTLLRKLLHFLVDFSACLKKLMSSYTPSSWGFTTLSKNNSSSGPSTQMYSRRYGTLNLPVGCRRRDPQCLGRFRETLARAPFRQVWISWSVRRYPATQAECPHVWNA